MKKTLISILALALVITLSLALPVSATQTNTPNYEDYFWQKLGQYRNEMIEIYGEDFALPDYFYYNELFRYYSGYEGATPDYVMVDATYYYDNTPFPYRYSFGEYIYDSRELGDKCLIYIPKDDKVYTLEQAYYNHVEGLEEAFAQIYCLALGKIGDADGDMTVNIHDATYIQKYLAKLIECGNSNPYVNANPSLFESVCDMNHDLKITIKDATAIQKYLAKLLVPSEFGPMPATADSVEYKEVDLGYCSYEGSRDMLVTNYSQLNFVFPNSNYKEDTNEFFEANALIYMRHYYPSGSIKGYVDGVYREGDTLYVKYREVHPWGGTDDIGVYHTALEIDKIYAEGVNKLVIENNSYYDFLGPKQ